MNEFETLKQDVLRIALKLSGRNPIKPVLARALMTSIRENYKVSWNDQLLGPIGELLEEDLLVAFRNNVLVTDLAYLGVMDLDDLNEIYFHITSKSNKGLYSLEELKLTERTVEIEQREYLIEVFELLRSCSVSELREICFYLGFNYEDLDGENKTDKVRELIEKCYRHSLLEELGSGYNKVYPNVSFPYMPQN